MANLFKPKTPQVEAATRMPDAQDPAFLEERRRKLAEQRQRGGRDSTIMSDNLTGSVGKLGA